MLKLDDKLLHFYKSKADNGNPYASLVLAKTMISNDDLKKDTLHVNDDCLKLIQQAIPLPEAMFILYKITKNMQYLICAADSNYQDALYLAAIELLQQGGQNDKAIEFMKKCVSLGNKDASIYMIKYYIDKKEFKNAQSIFDLIEYKFDDTLKKLKGILDICRANYDSSSIQFLREHMEDIECKYYVAIQTLFTGSEELLSEFKNNTEDIIGYKNIGLNACLMIARAFKNGIGVKKDLSKSALWYESALTKGFNDYVEVSDCYQELNQPQKVFDCLNKAAENGDKNGMVRLGKLLLEKNDEEGHEMAMIWFEQALELGSEEAKEILSKLQ
ncbi:Sel1 repeat-containing protein [Entamoeba nuttalli P19]|uniref:Sel1 repeat-containing protein n=1 Tax=Entamoeba nuttalli (strain P19) TaxID=1076696 RepID=K2GQ87_ENTNP|nr:Sel1 repeat-containing protein [Entamoeba nuttalli P19]EKE37068.1 Sel1 repeat-containing protein [Entamoeba nuttalli P19]|eukprot:XP_008860578.1 Sel1 repeat-containing protein [Entamoeba nuttalli P19]